MKTEFESVVLETTFRYMTPFILVYSVYVLFHGEYIPGGAFQAGGLIGMTVVLSHLVQEKNPFFFIQIKTAVVLAGMGVFLFIATGVVSMFNSGNFLEFHALPFTLNMSDASRHTLGMTIIEIGIAICVAATIIVIFTALQRGRKD